MQCRATACARKFRKRESRSFSAGRNTAAGHGGGGAYPGERCVSGPAAHGGRAGLTGCALLQVNCERLSTAAHSHSLQHEWGMDRFTEVPNDLLQVL